MSMPLDALTIENPMAALMDTNFERAQIAAKRDVAAARNAIRLLELVRPKLSEWETDIATRHLQVLQARVERPEATLLQLAGGMKLRKDQYSARLRRAIKFAARVGERTWD